MKVKNTVPLDTNLLHCLSDEISLRLIGKNPHLDFITIDSDSFALISRISLRAEPHEFYKGCLDNDCLYLPTKMGQILAIDKFSGEILATMNLSLPIMSDLEQDEQNIYCICGVPLSTKQRLSTENYCVSVCDKETGDKKLQTNYFQGLPTFLSALEYLWVVAGRYLLRYTYEGEIEKKIDLSFAPSYKPIFTEDFVICAYANGSLRVLKKEDLSSCTVIKAHKNISGPVLSGKNTVLWLTEEGICEVDFHKQVFQLFKLNKKMFPTLPILTTTGEVFLSGYDGSLVSYTLKDRKIQSIKLTNEVLDRSILVDKYLFVASRHTLHQVEV